MIRMTDVEMEYGNGTEAIRGLSMDVEDGEFVKAIPNRYFTW